MQARWIAGLLTASLGSIAPLSGQTQGELQVHQTRAISYPITASTQPMPPGVVTLIVHVDAEGTFLDALVTRYSDPAFADAALDAVPEWKYEPPLVDGVPTGIRQPLNLRFEAHGRVVTHTISEHLTGRLNRLMGVRVTDLVAPLSELDEPMEPIETMAPPPVGVSSESRVVIDLFIDTKGRPRMPVVVEADGEAVALAALTAVEDWRFPPPKRNGRPAIVRAKQEFVFSPAAGSPD